MRRVVGVCLCASLLVAATSAAQVAPDPTDLDLDGVPGVAGPPASPQPDVPSALVGAGRLLIDRSHGNLFHVGAFTNVLAANGWFVSEHSTGRITSAVLSSYDVLMVPTRSFNSSMTPFTPAEVASIQAFLGEGRGLWVLHDNLDPSAVNTLAQIFGVTFLYDYIQDPTNNEGELFWPNIHILEAHPITAGVGAYGLYLGDCLAVSPPAMIIGRADDDAYSLYCPIGSRPATLAVWEATGRAVFSADITPFTGQWYSLLRPEERLLLQNIANWLLGPKPTSTSPTTWGSVKAGYADEGAR